MNRKLTAIAIIMLAAGCLYAQTLDLSPYVTTGAKREILNTAPLITNLDTVGMSSAITSYVDSVVTPAQYIPVASVNGQTGAVVITAQTLGAWQNPSSATN